MEIDVLIWIGANNRELLIKHKLVILSGFSNIINHYLTVCSWVSILSSSGLRFLARMQTVTFDSVWYHSCLKLKYMWDSNMIRNLKCLMIYLIFGGWTGAGAWTGSVTCWTGVWFSAAGFSASGCFGAGISFWHLAIKSVKRFCFFSLFCWASFKPCSRVSKDLAKSFRLNSAVLKFSDISIWILKWYINVSIKSTLSWGKLSSPRYLERTRLRNRSAPLGSCWASSRLAIVRCSSCTMCSCRSCRISRSPMSKSIGRICLIESNLK